MKRVSVNRSDVIKAWLSATREGEGLPSLHRLLDALGLPEEA